jgi:hypothetical protein
MKNVRRLFAVASVMNGCMGATEVQPTTPPTPNNAPAAHSTTTPFATTIASLPATPTLPRTEEESLASLRALQVFSVGEMTWQQPEEAYNCYGPCPGSEAIIARARATAAQRLDAFVRRAEAVVHNPTDGTHTASCEPPAIDANLHALRALRVVGVGDFLRVQPHESARCYNLPCPEDVVRARAETCVRAEHLAQMVDATRGM